jgi:hypothetical protein
MRPAAVFGFALAVMSCHGAEGPQHPEFAGRIVNATATPGIGDQQLGTPYDARFLPLQGEQAGSLFPDSGPPRRRPLNQMQHEYVLVENEESLAANFSGWGFLNADASARSEWRHASYRAMQISDVVEVNDATEMRDLPPGSVYYLSRIYLGHGYEMVLSGKARDFHAGVRAKLLSFGGGIEGFAKEHHLTTKAVGRGLQPRSGEAIFAKTPDEIEKAYIANGPPVPIVMEFRQIPNARGLAGVIPWPEPIHVEVRLGDLIVDDDGTWGATPWTLNIGCEADGNPLPIANPLVWNGDTNKGGRYPVNRTWPLDLLPGDRLDCGVGGGYSGPLAGERSLPPARMYAPVSILPTTSEAGEMVGRDNRVQYRVAYAVTAVK